MRNPLSWTLVSHIKYYSWQLLCLSRRCVTWLMMRWEGIVWNYWNLEWNPRLTICSLNCMWSSICCCYAIKPLRKQTNTSAKRNLSQPSGKNGHKNIHDDIKWNQHILLWSMMDLVSSPTRPPEYFVQKIDYLSSVWNNITLAASLKK